MTERARSISYLLYGLFSPQAVIQSYDTGQRIAFLIDCLGHLASNSSQLERASYCSHIINSLNQGLNK